MSLLINSEGTRTVSIASLDENLEEVNFVLCLIVIRNQRKVQKYYDVKGKRMRAVS